MFIVFYTQLYWSCSVEEKDLEVDRYLIFDELLKIQSERERGGRATFDLHL